MDDWISVKDKLPLEPDEGIIFETIKVIITDGLESDVGEFQRGSFAGKSWACWSIFNDIQDVKITHWMYLPSFTKPIDNP